MCNAQCIDFVGHALSAEDVAGKDVIEVGAYDVNGSARASVEALGPRTYIGVDIANGPGVDRIGRAEDLLLDFGKRSTDIVISTEMIEHVADWRTVVTNFKQLVRPGGLVVLTTRSFGFPLHNYPDDYWRFEPDDMRMIFADCDLERLGCDLPSDPGVFVKARVPRELRPLDLAGCALHSMVFGRRVVGLDHERSLTTIDAEIQAVRDELNAVVSTRTWRYSAPLRSIYGKARQALR